MDPCMSYLRQVHVLLEDYEEIPPYQAIFEATDEEIGAKISNNAAVEAKSLNLLQKAGNMIRSIFEKIGEIISSILKFFKMDKGEYGDFKKFQEACKENPEFANMKVTYRDYTAINAAFEKELSKAEKSYRATKDDEEEKREKLKKALQDELGEIGKKIASVAKTAGKKVAVKTALDYAKQCRESAADIQAFIDHDMGLLKTLENEMGKMKFKLTKKRIDMLASKHEWLRRIAGGREKQAKTLRESFTDVTSQLSTVFSIVAGNKHLRKLSRDSVKDVVDIARNTKDAMDISADVAKQTYGETKWRRSKLKDARKSLETERNVFNNKNKTRRK